MSLTMYQHALPVVEAARPARELLHVVTAADLPVEPSCRIDGAYLHIPFCFHKCHYCDFYSLVETRGREGAFVDRLIAELAAFQERFETAVETIFVGGGTPTLLPVDQWSRLLDAIHSYLPLRAGGEVTVEANPETVTRDLARLLVDGGVNRISIGAQSFNPAHLKTLERWHEPVNVARSVEILRDGRIDNINLDLIFGIPGETLADWMDDLERVLALSPDHVSCYGLMYEPNTPLTQKLRAGAIQRIDEDLEAAMYEHTIDLLASRGFEHYEISNWALPSRRCRHNLLYWTNRNWWAFGPSASGHVDGLRWKNVPRLGDYLESSPWPAVIDVERLEDDARVGEELMLRLRMLDGVSAADLNGHLNRSKSPRREIIARQIGAGVLEWVGDRLRLTRRGLLVADTVMAALL